MVAANFEQLLKNPNDLIKFINRFAAQQGIVWTEYDRLQIADTLAKDPYVFAAIQKIVNAVQNINFMVGRYDNSGKFVEDKNNGLHKLLQNPSVLNDRQGFIEAITTSYFGFGETFIYGSKIENGNNKGKVVSLMYAPPQIVDIEATGIVPTGYVIRGNINQTIPTSDMLHIKKFNPNWDDLHGLPFVAVAGRIIDKLSASDEVETKTYQNGGPLWVASAKEPNSFLAEEFTTFWNRFKAKFSNPKNKKGIIGTSGAITIDKLGENPADMGTIEVSKNAVRILCVIWGLDPGTFDTEASTYNNKQQIDKAIYTAAAIPFANRLAAAITGWLGEAYGNVSVVVDTSDIEALQPNMKDRIDWMTSAGVFTDNEIREATGYTARESDVSDKTPNEMLETTALAGFSNDSLNQNVVE